MEIGERNVTNLLGPKRGFTTLGKWSAAMIAEWGEPIRPYLNEIWKASDAKLAEAIAEFHHQGTVEDESPD